MRAESTGASKTFEPPNSFSDSTNHFTPSAGRWCHFSVDRVNRASNQNKRVLQLPLFDSDWHDDAGLDTYDKQNRMGLTLGLFEGDKLPVGRETLPVDT